LLTFTQRPTLNPQSFSNTVDVVAWLKGQHHTSYCCYMLIWTPLAATLRQLSDDGAQISPNCLTSILRRTVILLRVIVAFYAIVKTIYSNRTWRNWSHLLQGWNIVHILPSLYIYIYHIHHINKSSSNLKTKYNQYMI
jgi:hypothetical protein